MASEPLPPARPARWASLLVGACRYLLGGVFLMAALTKVADLPAFRDHVILHTGLPYRVALVVAAWLPWLELTCGLCLIVGAMRREAALLLAVLLLLFLGHGLIRPAAGECACLLFPGTSAASSSPWWNLLRNLLLLGCAVPVVRARSS
jgi:uncharacterized membrane protein YphA (DoxX/SURF4 family)